MKKLLFAVALVVTTFTAALAQKPVAGTKGFTFGLTGLSSLGVTGTNQTGLNTLLFRYYVADGLAARVGLGYSKIGTKTETDNTKTLGTKTESKSTSGGNFAITLGAQKSFGENEKLEPYLGADILIGLGKGGGTLESTTTTTDAT